MKPSTRRPRRLRFRDLCVASVLLASPPRVIAQGHHAHGGDRHAMQAMQAAAPHGRHRHDGHDAEEAKPAPASIVIPRSPDYSDGIASSRMPGMHMLDAQSLAMLRVDRLEAFHGRHASGQAWDVQGWYGNDLDKLWLRSEGERLGGRVQDAGVELQWSHAFAPFWDTRLGVREDLGEGPSRHWVAFGIHGLTPYWFELEATAYAGPSGRTAVRLHVEYELRFNQWLVLQPEAELNLYGRNDAAAHNGSGLSDSRWGLRLRYEVRREFAPYIGVVWIHRHGASAGYASQAGEPASQRQFVAGLRLWF